MFKRKGHTFTEYNSDYSYLICENCGKEFGSHYGLKCPSHEFELPEEDISTGKPKMKPFNLEEAKAGKPVQDSQGNPVRIICFDRIKNEYPIVALIKRKTDSGYEEVIETFTADGRYTTNASDECENKLVMAPEKKEGWINLYSSLVYYEVYNSEEEALRKAADDVVATIKIEWEE